MGQIKSNDEVSGYVLTPRQEQLLVLLAAGQSNQEIADTLGITHGTVKQHLFSLFRRLGVTSRTKAVIAANNMRSVPSRSKNQVRASRSLSSGGGAPQFGWRMISVVAVHIPDSLIDNSDFVIARSQFLDVMRVAIEGFARALDGRFASMPYGGLLAWFGHPKAHADDVDRAVALAAGIYRVAKRYRPETRLEEEAGSLAFGGVGIGIASRAEIVAYDAVELLGAECFRRAAIIAREAAGLGVPLADEVTRRLAPLSTPWLSVRFREKQAAEQAKRLGKIFAIDSKTKKQLETTSRWGGMAFLDEVFQSVHAHVSQWISVECRPSAVGISLTDSIGVAVAARGFTVVRLRLASEQQRTDQAQALLVQLAQINLGEFSFESHAAQFVQEPSIALVNQLSALTQAGPLAVLVYGPKGIDRLVEVLGPAGVDRLLGKPVLVVGSNLTAVGQPQTLMRLLGPRPADGPLARVFSFEVPDVDRAIEKSRVDLQELLDSLSPQARTLAMGVAIDNRQSFLSFAKRLKFLDQEVRSALNELTSCGLVVPSGQGGFEFRDVYTAQALARLNVASEQVKP